VLAEMLLMVLLQPTPVCSLPPIVPVRRDNELSHNSIRNTIFAKQQAVASGNPAHLAELPVKLLIL
jgi:hypothetical protein